MGVFLSSGIHGFLCSVKKELGKFKSSFVSGISGWIIKNNGDAEFRSIYARDKLITNEFVYNRIRVTEDEEVVTSNGKIKEAYDNGDGTYTITLDLREGDYNPFADGDLLQGYYHSPGNSGVIYAKQNLTVMEDPAADQTMRVVCEDGSLPYQHMIIVRVGNQFDSDRQCFIKISSRTNSQYFFDNISEFKHLENPDYVKCVLGKIKPGLLPVWAQGIMGNVSKWFGLIADGVVLRGSFILRNNRTVEETIDDGVHSKVTEKLTEFQITESGINGKVSEVNRIALNAEKSAQDAAGAANNAAKSAKDSDKSYELVTTQVAEFDATAKGFSSTVGEVQKLVDKAGGIEDTISKKVASFEHTAEGFDSMVKDARELVNEAGQISGEIKENVSNFEQTANGFTSTVSSATSQAVKDAVDGADKKIETKVTSVVEQQADKWAVKILGKGPDGKPNSVLSAINLDTTSATIKAEKINLDGDVIAQKIRASGLNIDDKFVVKRVGNGVDVTVKGYVEADSGKIGDLTIRDEGITGIDDGGNMKLKVSNKPLGSIKELENTGTDTFTNQFSTRKFYDLYKNHQSVSIVINSSIIKAKRGCKMNFKYVIERLGGNEYVMMYQTPIASLMKYTPGQNPVFVNSVRLSNPNNVELEIPDFGDYIIQFDCIVEYGGVIEDVQRVGGSICYILDYTLTYSQQCTVIGSDGLYSYWGPNGYIYAKRGADGRMDIRMRGNIFLEDLNSNTTFGKSF